MTGRRPPVVCTGRAVDEDNQPAGEPCGKAGGMSSLETLRAVGWKIGPPGPDGARPAMCPRCGRDPELARLCATLTRKTSGRPDPVVMDMEPLPGLF